jgi:response regulator RpfG family c-di-GMP phosphodiesterase
MQPHPVHAYEWLSQVTYLQTAIKIPYFHHEKWMAPVIRTA